MSGKALALTERDRGILRDVARFGVMSRAQLMRAQWFASKTRANARLKQLVGSEHLAVRRQPVPLGGPRSLYLPGRLLAEGHETRTRFLDASDLFVAHQLGLVDIALAFERGVEVVRWLGDKELSGLALGLVPDAYLEYVIEGLTFCAFVEYDRGTETLLRIERKVRAYLNVAQSGRFERTFHRKFFRVLLVADTAGRLRTLSQAVGRLTDRVVRLTRLVDLVSAGPFASIWTRPGHADPEPLTRS